jgi:hypothetical protein
MILSQSKLIWTQFLGQKEEEIGFGPLVETPDPVVSAPAVPFVHRPIHDALKANGRVSIGLIVSTEPVSDATNCVQAASRP